MYYQTQFQNKNFQPTTKLTNTHATIQYKNNNMINLNNKLQNVKQIIKIEFIFVNKNKIF